MADVRPFPIACWALYVVALGLLRLAPQLVGA